MIKRKKWTMAELSERALKISFSLAKITLPIDDSIPVSMIYVLVKLLLQFCEDKTYCLNNTTCSYFAA